MINLTNKIIILTICLVSLLSGCAQKKEPVNYDVNSEKLWELQADGEIKDLKFVKGCSCDHHGPKRENWCREAYSIIVDNREPILMKVLKNPGLAEVGGTGRRHNFCKT